MPRIYLDHNATTPVDPAVLEAMLPFFSADFGNASSIHAFGQRARAAVETAREQVAALIHARPQEIVFTSGGTESDNHAIFGVVDSVRCQCATPPTSSPPPSNTKRSSTLARLSNSRASPSRISPFRRDGLIDLARASQAIRPETVPLITVMHANNELGTVQPLKEIGRIAARTQPFLPHRRGPIGRQDSRRRAGLPARSTFLCRVTKFTRQKVSARFTFRPARASSNFCTAATISAAFAPALKMSPESSASAKPRNLRALPSPKMPRGSPLCATNSNKACSRAFPILAPTLPLHPALPTPPTSRSLASKAKPWSSLSI